MPCYEYPISAVCELEVIQIEAMANFSCSLCLAMLLSLAILLTNAPATQGWGREGHSITCKIAQARLSKAAADALRKLLPRSAEGELASVCSWADDVRRRSKYLWSAPLHFANTPDVCNYKYSRDCHNAAGEEGMCVAGAINNFTAQLATYGDSSSEEQYNLTESLLFLSHFMGDIHQPLHVGFAGDKGGNAIPVRWYRRQSKLHHVWDSDIIEKAMKEFYDNDIEVMTTEIQRNITDGWSTEVPAWEKCKRGELACPNMYASESITLACNWAYKDAPADTILGDEYFLSRLPIVEERLAQGGVRLASTLNQIFDLKIIQSFRSRAIF